MSKISELFTKYGSDKNIEHTYGAFYDSLVSEMTVEKPVMAILELGVEAGYSMTAWKELFPDAVVIGIDKDVVIEDSIKNLPLMRQRKIRRDPVLSKKLRHADRFPPFERMPNLDVIQCVAPDFTPAITRFRSEGSKFDLIIDDASHTENDQVLGFHYLSEFLADGGVYVIEDLQNQEVIDRFSSAGWKIHDFRDVQNRWDDVIAVKRNL